MCMWMISILSKIVGDAFSNDFENEDLGLLKLLDKCILRLCIMGKDGH